MSNPNTPNQASSNSRWTSAHRPSVHGFLSLFTTPSPHNCICTCTNPQHIDPVRSRGPALLAQLARVPPWVRDPWALDGPPLTGIYVDPATRRAVQLPDFSHNSCMLCLLKHCELRLLEITAAEGRGYQHPGAERAGAMWEAYGREKEKRAAAEAAEEERPGRVKCHVFVAGPELYSGKYTRYELWSLGEEANA